jgi:hypothetical protein
MTSKRNVVLAAVPLLVAALLALAAPAAARPPALLVDQEQPLIDLSSPTTTAIGGASEQKLAQTFTVGIDGRLAGVGIPVGGCQGGVLEIEVQGLGADGLPDGVTRVRKSIDTAGLPSPVPASFVEIRLPRRLAVAAGDTLAVVLSNETGSCGLAQSPDGDTYTAGRAFFDARPNPPGWLPLAPPADDLPFQTVVFGAAP